MHRSLYNHFDHDRTEVLRRNCVSIYSTSSLHLRAHWDQRFWPSITIHEVADGWRRSTGWTVKGPKWGLANKVDTEDDGGAATTADGALIAV